MQVIADHKEQPGALMPVLQQAQEIYGYLPLEVQEMISLGLDIPWRRFTASSPSIPSSPCIPRASTRFLYVLAPPAMVKGSGDIYDKLSRSLGIKGGECTPDGKFSLEACRCIGACGLAPVMTINDDVYGRLSVDENRRHPGKISGLSHAGIVLKRT